MVEQLGSCILKSANPYAQFLIGAAITLEVTSQALGLRFNYSSDMTPQSERKDDSWRIHEEIANAIRARLLVVGSNYFRSISITKIKSLLVLLSFN